MSNPHSADKWGVAVHVWGEYACFTRPEMKVERVSYDVPTPSAARGILESILWKPAIEWRVRSIDVLRPVRWTSVRRNEVGEVGSLSLARKAMRRGGLPRGIAVEQSRQQRAALILRDVAYVIHADFRLTGRAGPGDNAGKFLDMFRRRVTRGQCHRRPYLGTREFAAFFGQPPKEITPIASGEVDLGWMFYDFDYTASPPRDRFFRARMNDGRIDVPDPSSLTVRT